MKKEVLALTLSACLLILVCLIQGPLLERQKQYGDAQNLAATSLSELKQQMTELAVRIGNDQTFLQNIELGATSALSRTLSGFVQIGHIDRLMVIDSACQVIADSAQDMLIQRHCPSKQAVASSQDPFHWSKTAEGIRLEFSSHIVPLVGKNYSFLFSTKLDQEWILARTQLASEFGKLDLRLTLDDDLKWYETPIWKDHHLTENMPRLTIISPDVLLKIIPGLVARKSLNLQSITLGTVVLFIMALSFLLRRGIKQELERTKVLLSLKDWVYELTREKNEQHHAIDHRSETILMEMKDKLARFIKRHHEEIEKIHHQNTLLQQQLVKAESDLLEKQAEYACLTEVQSLQKQMLDAGAAHLGKLYELASLGEDIRHLASYEIVGPSQKLYDLSLKWEEELTQMNTRKFIRSLSERIDAQGVSELDQAILTWLQHSHHINQYGINIALLSQRLLVELQANIQIAEHWHQILSKQDANQKTISHPLRDAQALINLHASQSKILFENVIPPHLSIAHLSIPARTLCSALYHLCIILIEIAKELNLPSTKIKSSLKHRDGRCILILSLDSESVRAREHDSAELSAKAEQHLYLSLQLLQAYPIKLTQLPTLQGVRAFALMWDEAPPQESTASMNLKPECFHEVALASF